MKSKIIKTLKKSLGNTLTALSVAGLVAVNSPQTINAQETAQPIKKFGIETKIEQKKQAPVLIGSVYGEAGAFGGEMLDENPVFLNISAGYNILDREKKDGVLLLPNIRIHAKTNRSECRWDKHLDVSAGVAYQKAPFIFGIDVGNRTLLFSKYKEEFKDQGLEGEFARIWGGYWNRFKGEPLSNSKMFPLNPVVTPYAEFEASTLHDGLIVDGRLEVALDALNIKGFKAGPYVAGKVNYDTKDYSWNRYGQISGGLKLSKAIKKGGLAVYFETGHRESFNEDGLEGNYNAIMLGFGYPLDF